MPNLLTVLASAYGQEIFIYTEPEILDFTNLGLSVRMIILTKDENIITVDVPRNFEILGNLLGFLSKSRVVMAWNLKNFISYATAFSKKPFPITRPFFDLKVIESYLGVRKARPKTFKEAKARLGAIIKNPLWEHGKKVYSSVHIPLITEVVPRIETCGLVNTNLKTILYPCYEIEGQINGRMKCTEDFKRCFNPHSMSDEFKETLTSPDYDDKTFVYLDFRHMEVSVLQWLSKDKILGSILETGQDLYELIWETVTGIDCNPELREISKRFFLPLVFGEYPQTLSKSIGISEATAWKLFKKTTDKFETAFDFVKSQKIDSNGMGMDRLGRLRKFEDDYQPKLRNFAIQSPASTICLHKLVKLFDAIKDLGRICFHLHDGYCIIAKKGYEDKLCKVAKETLESSEELYPGLILRVSVWKGNKLNKLEKVF